MENEDYSEKELLYYRTRFLQKISKSLKITNLLLAILLFVYIAKLIFPLILHSEY